MKRTVSKGNMCTVSTMALKKILRVYVGKILYLNRTLVAIILVGFFFKEPGSYLLTFNWAKLKLLTLLEVLATKNISILVHSHLINGNLRSSKSNENINCKERNMKRNNALATRLRRLQCSTIIHYNNRVDVRGRKYVFGPTQRRGLK